MKTCLLICLIVLICNSNAASFTSYNPQYKMGLPESPAQYGSYPYINQFDPFLSVIRSDGANQQQITSPPSISPPQPQSFNSFGGCVAPLVNVGGVCRCPNNGVYLTGICFPRDNGPTIVCSPPRTIIDSQCVCPNNEVFTASGRCIPQSQTEPTIPSSLPIFGTNLNPGSTSGSNFGSNFGSNLGSNSGSTTQCPAPRTYINGRCSCPNNGIFLSGRCFQRDTSYYPTQPIGNVSNSNSIEGLAKIFRSYDGTNNNVNFPRWGSRFVALQRRANNEYADGLSIPRSDLPNPRFISNLLGNIPQNQPVIRSKDRVTMAFVIWGQFLDHDIDLTEASNNEEMNIELPPGDPFFTETSFMRFTRSHTLPRSPGSIRTFPNQITGWIDGSNVYGSNETQSRYLRSFTDGKLRTSPGAQNLLPRQNNSFSSLFEAGDIRANENVMLTSYHTIFMREHNRVCDVLKARSPQMNDQMLFQAARHFVIGLLQKISLQEFLPVMIGSKYSQYVGPYRGYNPSVNPNIPVEFSSASFRGHGFIVDQILMVDKNFQSYADLTLGQVFFRPDFITSERISDIFRGLSMNLMKQKSEQMVNSVRNLLVLDPQNRELKLDLYSLNIQRARDHGLGSYNNVRVAVGLPRLTNFGQIISDQFRASRLRFVYNNNIDNVGLFDGIVAEDPVEGAVLGQLGCKIVGQTFRNLRDGDRFWYENAYPPSVVNEIKSTTFSDVIMRNTGITGLQKDIFHYYG